MFSPEQLLMLGKIRQEGLLEEAQGNRTSGVTRTTSPRLQERFFVRTGDFLISAGLRLRERYEPAVRPDSKVYQPGCQKASV